MDNNFENPGYLVVYGNSFGLGEDPAEAFDQMTENFGICAEDFDKCRWFTIEPAKVARYTSVVWESRTMTGELIEERYKFS